MNRHQKQTSLILPGITILAIILLASGLSELEFQSGRSLNLLEKLGELRSDLSSKPGESVYYGASSPGKPAQRKASGCLRAITRAWGGAS
jgi:hypothetical protein